MFEEEMNTLKAVYENRIKDNEEQLVYLTPSVVAYMKRFTEKYDEILNDKNALYDLENKINEEYGEENE